MWEASKGNNFVGCDDLVSHVDDTLRDCLWFFSPRANLLKSSQIPTGELTLLAIFAIHSPCFHSSSPPPSSPTWPISSSSSSFYYAMMFTSGSVSNHPSIRLSIGGWPALPVSRSIDSMSIGFDAFLHNAVSHARRLRSQFLKERS